MPPGKGAPVPTFPVAVVPTSGTLAPPPINDRFPLIIGQQLSLSYLSSIFRLCTTGYRQQYVDLLNELMEQDPHLFSVVSKRIISSAVGRVEFTPCKLPQGHKDTEAAAELCEFVQAEVEKIPEFVSSMTALLWAIYYGIATLEKLWTRDADGWHIERFSFVHTRRLAYPDYQSWDLHIWDQGQVYGWEAAFTSPTNANLFGLRIGDYPGKYVVHTPQLRGDYPTRDGIGRQVATWCIFKRVGARGASDYLERFAKSFMDVSWTTSNTKDPAEAEKEDILIAAQIAAQIGPGSGSYALHPNSIAVNPKSFDGGSSSRLTWSEWMSFCNAEMSKASLGGTLGTEVGKGGGGNRSLGEVQERAEVDLEKYDAQCLAETIKRDVVAWLVRLNRPNQMHLIPQVKIHVDPDPDPKTILALAKELTDMGAPVDLDETADAVGITLIEQDDLENGEKAKPRRSYKAELSAVVKALTAVDYPVDLDALAKIIGVPIIALKDIDNPKFRRSRVITGGKDMPVEPDGSNDPNDPNFTPMAPPSDADGGGDAAPVKALAPNHGKSGKTKPKAKDKAPGATSPKPTTKKPAKTVKATDAEAADALEVNTAIRGVLLLSGRADKAEAQAVFDLLSEDYPKNRLDWILSGHWEGPLEVSLEDINFSNRDSWRASHEDITPYADRIQQSIDTKGKKGNRKPVVLVKPKGADKYVIVDGHHRTLASEHLEIPVLAYIAHVHVKEGPWDELHSAQKKGSSKGSYGASYRTVEASYT